jgi:hypothetical protein
LRCGTSELRLDYNDPKQKIVWGFLFMFGYVKSIRYLCFTMEDMKTTQSISEIHIQADLLYATNRDEYQIYIESLSCDQMKSLDEHQRNERFTDPNFSYGAERVTCLLAGKQHHDLGEKHGDDSSDNAEAKPEKQKTRKNLFQEMCLLLT